MAGGSPCKVRGHGVENGEEEEIEAMKKGRGINNSRARRRKRRKHVDDHHFLWHRGDGNHAHVSQNFGFLPGSVPFTTGKRDDV